MASLLVRSGDQKGQRLSIRVPVVNIGRGDYNDVVLAGESVSTAHAKLQRREGVWILSDLGSTNGTFVDGERVEPELPVSPGATIRFGDVSVLFEPTDDAYGTARSSGTKMVQAVRPAPAPPPARAPAPPAQAAPAARPHRPPSHRPVATGRPRSGSPTWLVPALIVAALAAAIAFFLLK
jgi:pSer/pThr/pTyr-binding forkhead associated (FHA) protein